ncbi:hypothetical protein [Salinibacter ruber]|uniref:hypothetical protein n=1 Tax=Salinibacter ruber TaxID=146919 RepID=UPI002072EF2D|nr:hypothetical protein [Salinibacter ruber]
MPASENALVGVNLLTLLNDTLIGAQTDASLSASQDLIEIITKQDSGFIEHLPGSQDWSVSHSGLILDDSGSKFVANGNAKLELEFDDGSGTAAFHEVPRLSSLDLSFQQNLAETGGLDRELWTYRRPAERMMEVDIEGSYLDPASDLGDPYDEIWKAKENSRSVTAKMTVASRTFSCDLAPGDLEISAATGGEDATISLSFASDNEITTGGTAFDSSVSAIMDAFFNQASLNFALEQQEGGTAVSGSTTYTGTGYLDNADLSLADGEEATLDADFAGDGALSRSTVA